MASASAPLPLDVKLMNFAATLLFAGFIAVVVWAVIWWALRNPMFSIAGITVQGDVTHNSAATLRANVTPRLNGNFFTLDLRQARQTFESVPWVRTATVRRHFPNRLQVQLHEHQAVAFWGAEPEVRLVNSFGEVFEANAGDVEGDNLPRLSGPDGQAREVLAMYRTLAPLLQGLDLSIEELALSGHGSWSAQLDTGAVLELGRGNASELTARVRVFAQTLTQVTSKYGRRPEAVVSADLRHADGYALRLRGVSTTDAVPAKK